MPRISNNSLLDINKFHNNIAKLSFYHDNNISMVTDKLSSNLIESSYSEIILNFDSDINKTVQYINELQIALEASNNKYIADDINLTDFFPEIKSGGSISIMGVDLIKGGRTLDKKEIKKILLKNVLGKDYEKYPSVYKAAKTKKGDEVSLPLNASEHEKIVFLALKGQESVFYDFAEKINKQLNIYRDLRKNLSNQDLRVLDEGIHGFTRTGVDGIIQQSTHFDSDNIYQISPKHQKNIKHLSHISEIQKLMKEVGITEVEIDPDDSLEKFYNFLSATKDFTVNTTSRFSCKTRKLGNLGGHNMDIFGLFFPALKMIAVDSRDPSALVHEFAHAVDFNNDFVSETTRMQFVNLATNVLNKQYFPNVSAFDIVKNYDKIANIGDDNILDFVKKLYSNEEYDFNEFINKFNENKEYVIISIARKLADSTFENELLKKAKSASNKKSIRDAIALFNSMKTSDGFDIDEYIYGIDNTAKYNKNYIRNNKYPELSNYLVEHHAEINVSENKYELPSGYHYLGNHREVIARAGEIGYILSKYGYDGHKDQEELDQFFDKVRKIQEIEKEKYGSIRACHPIDTYLDRNEYFGLVNSSEEFLTAIKDYYKPFFQPKNIYNLVNDDIELIENTRNLDPVDTKRLEKLMELSRFKEFEMHEIKKQLKANRRSVKKERKSFDKNKNPLAYITEYDGLEGMFKYNSENNIIEPEKLLLYVIQNIDDLARTSLSKNNNTDIDKVDNRIECIARLIANKEIFCSQTQKAISAFERGNFYENTSFNKSINSLFKNKIKDNISSIVIDAPNIINLSTRSGINLDIYNYVLELSEKFKEDPNYDGQISLKNLEELKKIAIQRRNNANEAVFNVFNGTVKSLSINDDKSLHEINGLQEYFTSRLEQSETKVETLMLYIKALGSIRSALDVNINNLKPFISPNKDNDEVSNSVILSIRKSFLELNKDMDSNHDFIRSMKGYRRGYNFELNGKSINFDFINDETKRRVFKEIVDSGFSKIVKKTKQPKGKKLIASLTDKDVSQTEIDTFLQTLTFNDLEQSFSQSILSDINSYNDFAKLNIALSDDFSIVYNAIQILTENTETDNFENELRIQRSKNRSEAQNFLSYFKNYMFEKLENIDRGISQSPSDIVMKTLYDDEFISDILDSYSLNKEVEKYQSVRDLDTFSESEAEKYNEVILNHFIKPLNNALSSKDREHAIYVLESLNNTFNNPESPLFSNDNVKRAFATYLTVLFENDIIDDPFQHSKDAKEFTEHLKIKEPSDDNQPENVSDNKFKIK